MSSKYAICCRNIHPTKKIWETEFTFVRTSSWTLTRRHHNWTQTHTSFSCYAFKFLRVDCTSTLSANYSEHIRLKVEEEEEEAPVLAIVVHNSGRKQHNLRGVHRGADPQKLNSLFIQNVKNSKWPRYDPDQVSGWQAGMCRYICPGAHNATTGHTKCETRVNNFEKI